MRLCLCSIAPSLHSSSSSFYYVFAHTDSPSALYTIQRISKYAMVGYAITIDELQRARVAYTMNCPRDQTQKIPTWCWIFNLFYTGQNTESLLHTTCIHFIIYHLSRYSSTSSIIILYTRSVKRERSTQYYHLDQLYLYSMIHIFFHACYNRISINLDDPSPSEDQSPPSTLWVYSPR